MLPLIIIGGTTTTATAAAATTSTRRRRRERRTHGTNTQRVAPELYGSRSAAKTIDHVEIQVV